MPQTRKNRKNRSKRGGDIDPYERRDNKGRVIGFKNNRGRPLTSGVRRSARLMSTPVYDTAAQPDVISDISSPSSRSSSSYISSPTSSLSSDDGERWRASTLGSWAAIMGDAADPRALDRIHPRYRQTAMRGTRLDFDNVGSGLLKKSRKSRKGRKMRKSRKGRGKTRKNRRRSRRHSRRHRRR